MWMFKDPCKIFRGGGNQMFDEFVVTVECKILFSKVWWLMAINIGLVLLSQKHWDKFICSHVSLKQG
jgi:hypothetical protein